MTNGNESVMPDLHPNNPQFNSPHYGLTKREYFAAMAMQGMAASAYWAENFTEAHSALESAMSVSVAAADALISELNKITV